MDDLSDLVWSEPQKKRPPQLPKKPANLSSQTSSSIKSSDDAFGNLVDFRGQAKPDISKLSLAEQQQHSKSPSPFMSPYSGTSTLRPQRYTPSQSSSGYNSDAQTLLEPTVRQPSPASANNSSGVNAFDSLLDPLGEFGRGSGTKSPASSLNALRSQNSTPSNFSDKGGSTSQRQEHQWDLDLLDQTYGKSPARSDSVSPAPQAPLDPFDMDPFEPSPRQQTTSSPSWSNQVADDLDNPLGILAEPANKVQKSPPAASPVSSMTSSPRVDRDGLIQQIADMGFSRDQAVNALDATENGTNLAMAIDLLLQDREATRPQLRPSPKESQRQRRQQQPQQQYRSPTEVARSKIWDEEPPQRAQSPSSRQHRPLRTHRDEYMASDESNQPTFQDQKEKIVSQASELGGYLYKNASSFYKSSREKVSKYMQDMQVENERARSRGDGSPAKPRWMTESNDYNDENVSRAGKFEKYADESSDEDPEAERQKEEEFRLERERQRKRYVEEQKESKMKQQQKQKQKQQLLDTADTYVSPSRRRDSPSGRTSGRNSPQTAPPPKRTATPPVANVRRRPTRAVVEASPSQIEGANSHKQQGNEQFKLGQYSEAEQAYTQAMSYLPGRHDHLIILYNNRAAALFKNGEYKRAIEDASSAIQLIGPDYLDDTTTVTIQGVQMTMRDQAIKALSRKAQALEHLEKYADAVTEYNTLLRIDSNGKTASQTQQGLARCRKSINDADKIEQAPKRQQASSHSQSSGSSNPFSVDFDPITAAASAPAIAPATAPVVSKVDVDKSKAVKQMRANAAKQSAEEEERLKITDDVDRRLHAWKHGKENNLRALLASLDTVLWSEATWKGANMSELIEPKRCKIVYMKAIAKVHPDKLGSSVTVEQKMLASGIFGTLNHAWDAFKSQNGL